MQQSKQNDYHVVTLKKLPRSQKDQALADMQRIEKHTFPAHEAMAFDATFVSKQNVLVLLVRDDSAKAPGAPVLAYAVCIRQDRRLLLEKLCVHEKHRQRGVGAHLLSFIVALALRTACTNIDLWVDEARFVAKKLYQRHGFTQRGRIEDYYRPGRNALKMSLDIC